MQVAHGVTIGQRVLLASQVGISGSAVVEDDVVMGGQVGVAGHLRVGKGTIAAGRTVITKSVEPGRISDRLPGNSQPEWRKASVIFRRLPELKKRLEKLEQLIAEITRRTLAGRRPLTISATR